MTPVSVELFAHPWDIVYAGEGSCLDQYLELGVNCVHVTVSYHSVRRCSFFNYGLLSENRLCMACKAGA